LREFKEKTKSKRAFTSLMLDCLIEPAIILKIVNEQN
jgi:hypothetical protein